MPNSFFSPNASVTGGALFASFNSKDGSVFFKFLKQIANNPDKKGNFDGKSPINVKFGQDEVADIIRAVRVKGEAKFYHKFEDVVTSGSFKAYSIAATDKAPAREGFVFNVKKGEAAIKIGFSLAGAERLSLFLQNALVHIFDAEYSQDLKEAKEYNDKKAGGKPTPKTDAPAPATTPAPEPEPSDAPEPSVNESEIPDF